MASAHAKVAREAAHRAALGLAQRTQRAQRLAAKHATLAGVHVDACGLNSAQSLQVRPAI